VLGFEASVVPSASQCSTQTSFASSFGVIGSSSNFLNLPHHYNITAETVFNKLERIDICKATGPYNLPNWLLCDFT